MKKTTITTNNELFNLYFGISSVYGEFILETAGDPTCLNELEDAGVDALIDSVNSVISNPNTYWEPCNEDDEEYVSDCLEAWGIDHD